MKVKFLEQKGKRIFKSRKIKGYGFLIKHDFGKK
jgi:hypothetical protein